MRFFYFVPVLILAALAASPAPAEEPVTDATVASAPTPETLESKLFDALKRERDPEKARSIASQIMASWKDSGSATVAFLMQWADTSIDQKKNAAALDFLDQVTVLKPDYAEAWNRRATLHYAMGDTRKSMADINEVLKRNPRYFPAIAGMATILTESGQDELALKAWERYLDIYPAEREAQQAVEKLSEKLAGNRT
ncbi:Tetratricopeptide repeat-containing protein [Rhizobium sp. RU35A]|uniref:hypothetical protein n=1 Tax=Rhizobium sp. RU35A TaxID=1907414 RepID=UPI000955ADB7|nr:hypothetical protein [Rhizobium sp. RU35A]SIQ15840.1 Tetratricopeptide repeat-containing protein [Rhizobium sp. RU35A]